MTTDEKRAYREAGRATFFRLGHDARIAILLERAVNADGRSAAKSAPRPRSTSEGGAR